MTRPRALDLFCGAGGAAMGLFRAGFDVVGVDIKRQPRYPFPYVIGDALRPPMRLEDFDLVWASPPCQGYSRAKNNGSGRGAPRLVPAVRQMLEASGALWILENVPGAPLRNSAMLCGASFGLGVAGMDLARHRLFETNFCLLFPQCQHKRGNTVGVYGNGTNEWHRRKLGRNVSVDEQREAMGMPWAVRSGLSQAIPPAYSEHIGRYAMMALGHDPDGTNRMKPANTKVDIVPVTQIIAPGVSGSDLGIKRDYWRKISSKAKKGGLASRGPRQWRKNIHRDE